jgi:hypothetical protein
MSWWAALIMFVLTPRYTFVFALGAVLAILMLVPTLLVSHWTLALERVAVIGMALIVFLVEGCLIVAFRKWLDARSTSKP